MTIDFHLVLAVLVAIVSSARLNRLLTQDYFPPTMWIRNKWDALTEDRFPDWNRLFHCHWCMSFWTTIPVVLWGWLSDLHISWWVVNGILAISYLNAMLVERDEIPTNEEED